MFNLVQKLMYAILSIQEKVLRKKLDKNFQTSYTNSTSKLVLKNGCTLSMNSQTEKNKEKLDLNVKSILKKYENDPDKLLEFIEKNGTEVYKVRFANIILSWIGEDEGMISELNGLKALFINLAVQSKLALHTEAMFVMRDLPLNSYYMVHQFHKWYAMKLKLPGFDSKTQDKFKKFLKTSSDEEIKGLNLQEIISLKEAIARDVEAINFVVDLAKGTEGSKKALQKIVAGSGAAV